MFVLLLDGDDEQRQRERELGEGEKGLTGGRVDR